MLDCTWLTCKRRNDSGQARHSRGRTMHVVAVAVEPTDIFAGEHHFLLDCHRALLPRALLRLGLAHGRTEYDTSEHVLVFLAQIAHAVDANAQRLHLLAYDRWSQLGLGQWLNGRHLRQGDAGAIGMRFGDDAVALLEDLLVDLGLGNW